MKSRQLWVCPSYSNDNYPSGTCQHRLRGGIGYNWGWSAASQATYGAYGDFGWLPYYRKIGSFERPAELIVFGDANCMGFGPYNGLDFNLWKTESLPPNTMPGGERGYIRHNGGLNLAFADGHVKWMKPTAIAENQLYPVVGMPTP